jgi:Protein of unknown function (DUF4239)
MSTTTISLVVLAFVFGGALVGMFLRTALPQHHLSDASKDIVRVGIGLVVTITALVLSLLIASAKAYYDAQSTELTEMSAKIVLLDRVLAHYGPETKEARELLRADVARALDQMWSKNRSPMERSSPANEVFYDKIQELTPRNDAQRSLQAQALSIALALGQTRWLTYEQSAAAVSKPLLVVLVFWLTIIFISFGLYAPNNITVVASLFLSALAVSGAVLLILDMYTPYAGLIHISSAPLRAALARLGQ